MGGPRGCLHPLASDCKQVVTGSSVAWDDKSELLKRVTWWRQILPAFRSELSRENIVPEGIHERKNYRVIPLKGNNVWGRNGLTKIKLVLLT